MNDKFGFPYLGGLTAKSIDVEQRQPHHPGNSRFFPLVNSLNHNQRAEVKIKIRFNQLSFLISLA